MLIAPGVMLHEEEGMVACSWALDGVVCGALCWWGQWLLCRDAQRCCVYSELGQGRATLLSLKYFPRIHLSHDPKPSITFMIYNWHAGRIFHNLLCVYSCYFSMEWVIPLEKKNKITDVAENHNFNVELSILELTQNLDTVIFLEGRKSTIWGCTTSEMKRDSNVSSQCCVESNFSIKV